MAEEYLQIILIIQHNFINFVGYIDLVDFT